MFEKERLEIDMMKQLIHNQISSSLNKVNSCILTLSAMKLNLLHHSFSPLIKRVNEYCSILNHTTLIAAQCKNIEMCESYRIMSFLLKNIATLEFTRVMIQHSLMLELNQKIEKSHSLRMKLLHCCTVHITQLSVLSSGALCHCFHCIHD